jgi:hypothetical protein
VGLAGFFCPTGLFVVGFNGSGFPLCANQSSGISPSARPLPGVAAVIESAIEAMPGILAGSGLIGPGNLSGIPYEGTITPLGYAWCQPQFPRISPTPATPPMSRYGCQNNVTVSADTTGDHLRVTIQGTAFGDAAGSLSALNYPSSHFDAYTILNGVNIVLTAPLTGSSPKAVGTFQVSSITYTGNTTQVDFSNTIYSGLSPLIGLFNNLVVSEVLEQVRPLIQAAVQAQVPYLPSIL